MVQSQEDEENDNGDGDNGSPSPSGTIVNTEYLALSSVTFEEDDNKVIITGNVSNISPDKSFTNVIVVGQLYGEENQLITTGAGRSGLTNLQPGQQSVFTLTTNIPSDDEVTRYIVMPGGSSG